MVALSRWSYYQGKFALERVRAKKPVALSSWSENESGRLKAMVGRNLLPFLVARESWEFVRGVAGGNSTVGVPS